MTEPARLSAAGKSSRWTILLVCAALAVITWIVFGRTSQFGFVNLDDNDYVYENLHVTCGLTSENVAWAFTHSYAHNWHPLTWVSLMLDAEIHGVKPGGYHLTNVLLHTATVILLFLLLRRMTGFLWRSAFVAALFAVHPLHVESVAWIAERKDVLSGFFFMLTLFCYARYVRRQSAVPSPQSTVKSNQVALDCRLWTLDYWFALLFFACGLMSKPMLVTLPIVLLLLDFWPLKRVQGSGFKVQSLLVEKIPFFALSALSCIATLIAQHSVIQSFEKVPVATRLGNIAVSYVDYIVQMFFPVQLANYYPFPEHGFPWWQPVCALGLLIAISVFAFARCRHRPYLFVGWLWYLVMLVPVIGIVQVGTQAHADRYTYLSQIGLYVLLAWSVAEAWRWSRWCLGAVAVAVILVCAGCAWTQAGYWQSGETLWRHALSLRVNDEVPGCHDSLGAALDLEGRTAEAMVEYKKALALVPDFADARNNLGFALLRLGRTDEAIAEFREAVDGDPALVIARNNLGNALLRAGRQKEAVDQFEQVLKADPESGSALNSLAWVLATSPDASLRNGARAVESAEKINRITDGKLPECLDTLAAAYAEAGRFDEAVRTEQRAIDLAKTAGKAGWSAKAEERLKLYRASRAFREVILASDGVDTRHP